MVDLGLRSRTGLLRAEKPDVLASGNFGGLGAPRLKFTAGVNDGEPGPCDGRGVRRFFEFGRQSDGLGDDRFLGWGLGRLPRSGEKSAGARAVRPGLPRGVDVPTEAK